MDSQQFGPYRLDSLVGTGSTSEVYRAFDTRRQRAVALKLLPEGLSRDEEFEHRLRRESHVAAQLREPHVIPIHDYGEIDERLFIDMRLVDGPDLSGILAEQGALPPARAVHLIEQLGEALDAAHADGLVHRDIKPSNVLVTPHDFVYVVDFGIAAAVGTTGTTATSVGTMHYLAPERHSDDGAAPVDGRADVYSMACLLHECLTGQPPFSGTDAAALREAHRSTPPPRPSKVRLGVPATFDAVVARGMAKDPDARYASAGELARAARAALTSAQLPRPRSPMDQRVQLLNLISPAPAAARPVLGNGIGRHRRNAGHPLWPGRPRPAVLALATGLGLVLLVVAFALLSPGAPAQLPVAANALAAAPAAEAAVSSSVAVPTVAGAVPVGATSGFVAVAPNGRYAYVANREAGTVTVVDTTLNAVTATIAVPAGPPHFVAFAPDGRRAYLSIYNTDRTVNLVAVLDTATNTVMTTFPVGKRPFALAVSPDGRWVYVPSHDTGAVDVIDTATNEIAGVIPVAPNPHWVEFSTDGSRAYVANHESNVVSVLDVATRTVVTTIPVGTSPHSVAVAPDGSRILVVNYDEATVSVIDPVTNTVTATIPVGANPQDVTFAPDGRYAYVACVNANSVWVVDTATNAVTATIPTGSSPTSVGVRPDGRQAYVTNLDDGTATVLDIAR